LRPWRRDVSENFALNHGEELLAGSFEPAAAEAPRDDARLRALVDREYDFIWRSLRRLGLPDGEVDDAAQEVFLVIARKLNGIQPSDERRFLFGTVLRIAATGRRTIARRREAGEAALSGMYDSRPMAEELLDRKRARELFDQIVLDMDLAFRTVFVLYEFEELSVPEIASLLELPAGTVASRLARARQLFDQSVKRHQARASFRGSSP
jgi:RNA polymerase sigma-70 factor, ECF subfamily